MGVNLKISYSQGCLVFAYTWKCGQRSRCTHTTRARTFVSVAVCVSRKLRPCPSYSGRRDRNDSVHWRSLYKGGVGRLLESLALPRAGQNLCQKRIMTASTNNGLHECMDRYTMCLCRFSPRKAQKWRFSKPIFDVVTTQNDHPTYVRHVLGRTIYGFHLVWVLGVGGSRDWCTTCLCSFSPYFLPL